MYLNLGRNKWLKMKPDKLYSDGVDKDKNIVFDKHVYPTDYIDAYYYGKKNCGDLSNYSLHCGFHEIVISTTDPNRRDSIKNLNTNRYDCQVQG